MVRSGWFGHDRGRRQRVAASRQLVAGASRWLTSSLAARRAPDRRWTSRWPRHATRRRPSDWRPPPEPPRRPAAGIDDSPAPRRALPAFAGQPGVSGLEGVGRPRGDERNRPLGADQRDSGAGGPTVGRAEQDRPGRRSSDAFSSAGDPRRRPCRPGAVAAAVARRGGLGCVSRRRARFRGGGRSGDRESDPGL